MRMGRLAPLGARGRASRPDNRASPGQLLVWSLLVGRIVVLVFVADVFADSFQLIGGPLGGVPAPWGGPQTDSALEAYARAAEYGRRAPPRRV